MCICVCVHQGTFPAGLGWTPPPSSMMSVGVKGLWMDRRQNCMNHMICVVLNQLTLNRGKHGSPRNSGTLMVHAHRGIINQESIWILGRRDMTPSTVWNVWPLKISPQCQQHWAEQKCSRHNQCAQVYRAQAGLWFDVIKYLLHGWSLQPVSHGNLLICAHSWSPPLCLCPTPECR